MTDLAKRIAEGKLANPNEEITFKYKDHIHNKVVDVTAKREVRNYIKSSDQRIRRKDNEYQFFNKSWDTVFNEDKPENEQYLIDPASDMDSVLEAMEGDLRKAAIREQRRALVENALHCLTPLQREVIDLIFYENKSEREISKILGISHQTVHRRRDKAIKNLKNYIFDTQN